MPRGTIWRAFTALTLILTLLGGALTIATPGARAAAIVVTSLADPTGAAGTCTLRDALAAANTNAAVGGCPAGSGADAITFQSGLAGTITLAAASGQLLIGSDVALTGPPGGITISGGDAVRVFRVDSGTVALSNLTIADGNATDGAGSSGDSIGGGIANINATIAISGVTFVNNRTRINSNSAGGAIANGFGTITIANSTFGGNASENGGAVFAQGSTRITNSTFAGNSAPQGAAVYGGGATLQNTIVAETGSGCFSTTNGGNNLDEGTSCGFGAANGSISGQPARLGPLANNGGPTQTRALLGGSAAIDAGDNAACAAAPVNATDQRGIPRPQGLRCDIGAYEVGPPNPAPTITGLATAPSPLVAGAGGSVTLTVTGTNFVSGFSTIAINGTNVINGSIFATTYGSPTQLTTTFSAFPRTGAGAYTVTVTTSAPGGGTSNPLTLTVQNPAPTLTGLAPVLAGTSTPGVLAGSGATTLTLTGTGFAPGATVQFGGTTLTPTAANISATTITVTVPASLLTVARLVAVAVTNPGPGGGTSGSANFTVANAAPTLTDSSPTTATAGQGDTVLTVTGTGFAPGSTIAVGGETLATTVASATQAGATIPAALLRATGNLAITVTVPGPGGGTAGGRTLVVNPANAAQLAVAAGSPQSTAVTTPFGTNLAVTVRDQYGNPVANGTIVTFAAPASGPSGTFAGFDTTATATTTGGVATAPALVANGIVGAYSVLASAGGGAVPFALTNTHGPVDHFDVAAPATSTAGAPLGLTVTARDAQGNLVGDYTGTVRLTSADPQATLPADYTFVAGDGGTKAFAATLRLAGGQTIAATDTVSAGVNGTAGVTVAPAAPASLTATGGTPQTRAIGQGFAPLTVVARDAFGNPVAGVAVTFAAPSTGASATFPGGGASGGVATGADGVATAPVITANGTAGAYTVVASGAGGSASFALTNTPGPATRLVATAAAIGPVRAGDPVQVTVTALDAGGNVATGYTGTVRLTSGGVTATLPADYAFTATDAGTHTFSVILRTGGAQTITATDTANGALTASATVQVVAPAAPPQASVAPASLAFGARQVGTASDSQQITVTNGGGSALTIAGVSLTGSTPGDFAVTFDTCVGSVPAGGSCVVGVRFAPTATGDRAATLRIADDAAGSPRTVALTGTGTPPPASPAPRSVVTASAQGQGSVTPAGATSYATGGSATYAAVPAAGQVFVGWTLDDAYVGYVSPLTFIVPANRTLVATFVARPTFADVPTSDPDYQAITTLAALGIVNPTGVNGSGQFQPGRAVARAEVAAFIARAFGWEREFHGNSFPDKCDPSGANCVDDALWNAVAALRDYGVVGGYNDAATCGALGTTAPCYLPRESVLKVQVVSIVARAFTKAPDLRPTGFWDRLAVVAGQYANVPDSGTQRSDLATYRANAGAIPGQTSDAQFPQPTDAATRRFVIQALWQAMQATFGQDRVP